MQNARYQQERAKTLKRWKVNPGDSTKGATGFVVYGLLGETKEEALKTLKETFVLPDHVDGHGEDDDGNRTLVSVDFNRDALTLENIAEDDAEMLDEEEVIGRDG